MMMTKDEELDSPKAIDQAPHDETNATTSESNSSKLITSLLTDDEESAEFHQLQDLVRMLNINGEWFRRQIWVILMIVSGTILYITNRYQAQQEIIEEESLRNELQDWKFRSLTRSSELTLKCRQSKLEEQLHANGDSTLKTSSSAPFRITRD